MSSVTSSQLCYSSQATGPRNRSEVRVDKLYNAPSAVYNLVHKISNLHGTISKLCKLTNCAEASHSYHK